MTEPLRQDEIAYAAGFFDGEGCVSIMQRAIRFKSHDYALHVRVGNTNLGVLEWFKSRFSGQIYRIVVTGNRQQSWQWHLSGKKAVEFLTIVEPFLKVKVPQIAVARQFVNLNRRDPAARAALYGQMRMLNMRGVRQQNGMQPAAVTNYLTH